MSKILEIFANTIQKCGFTPAVSILALFIGGYGCYQAQLNAKAIQHQAIEQARLSASLDINTEKLKDQISDVNKTLIEMTTQIKLLIDGKLVVGIK